MQNKCNCGCDQGFVPVSGNWDFNTNGNCDCGCDYQSGSYRQQSYSRQQGSYRRNRRSNDCQQCGEYASYSNKDDCQCERCDDSRQVECCDQNTYIRDMDDSKYNDSYGRNRSGNKDCDECNGCSTYNRSRNNDCDTCGSAYSRNRSSCSGDDDCQCETCTRNRSRRSNNGCNECCDNTTYTHNRSGNNGCEKDCDYSGESAYNRNRSGDCGCDKNDSTYNRNRSSNCGCDKDNATTYARSNKNRTVGMMNVERQKIDEIFESESALRAGTIFPELHKPMNGYCPCDENCGTCAQAAAFAAWELRLYLNTHPNDKEALALFRKLCKETEDINYATTFLTDDGCTNGWDWVKNPWPWEYDCQCGD